MGVGEDTGFFRVEVIGRYRNDAKEVRNNTKLTHRHGIAQTDAVCIRKSGRRGISRISAARMPACSISAISKAKLNG